MKTGTNSYVVALVLATAMSTGCKSMKVPGTSWLSWNREPDAAMLAGSQEVPELPVSPASKYNPDSVAALGSQNGTPSSMTSNGTSSPYGYTTETVSAPKAGLAAQANGYQTGPYQVGPTPSSSSMGGGLPNPYGGTYAGVSGTTATPNVSMPTTNTRLPSASSGVPGSTVAYPSGTPGVVPPAAVTSGLPSYPSMPAATPSATSSTAYAPGTTPGTVATAGRTTSVGATALGVTAPPSGSPSASSVYAPGTTGRNTQYNFGTSGTSVATPPGAVSGTPVLR
jgi:hypothetical protein